MVEHFGFGGLASVGYGGSEGLKRRNTEGSDRGGPVKYSTMMKLVFSTRKYNSNFLGVKSQFFVPLSNSDRSLYRGPWGSYLF